MRAVRSTCKDWDTLSKSGSFSKMHIDKISAGEESMMVAVLMGYNLYLMNVVNDEDPLIECKGRDVDWMTSACSYVRSLVNIKQPAAGGGKRKQQSEFKKQRYDQNMGRIVGLKKRS
ncbi:unnamed protein product [Brassica oleracea]